MIVKHLSSQLFFLNHPHFIVDGVSFETEIKTFAVHPILFIVKNLSGLMQHSIFPYFFNQHLNTLEAILRCLKFESLSHRSYFHTVYYPIEIVLISFKPKLIKSRKPFSNLALQSIID